MLSRRLFLGLAATSALATPAMLRAENNLKGWSSRTVQLHAEKPNAHPPAVSTARLHPSGEMLVTAGDDHRIAVWNTRDGKLMHELAEHLDWVRTLAFSHDGKLLASAGNDRRILLWDPAAGKLDRHLASLPHSIAAIGFDPQGKLLAVAGFTKTVTLIDVATGKVHAELAPPDGDLRVVAFSPDGKTLAAAGRSGVIRLWDLDRHEVLRDITAHKQRVRALLFTPEGAIISGGDDRLVQMTPASPGAASFSLPPQNGKIHALALCDDGHLAVAGSDNRIALWDLKTLRVLRHAERAWWHGGHARLPRRRAGLRRFRHHGADLDDGRPRGGKTRRNEVGPARCRVQRVPRVAPEDDDA